VKVEVSEIIIIQEVLVIKKPYLSGLLSMLTFCTFAYCLWYIFL